ncbi:MAG: DEAD/DEAH box helicase [Candidatus Latescibacterota bacterium]
MSALDRFHPLVAEWFREKVGTPTPVQEQAWPRIAQGGHVLLTAPTGSGKTLAAFLWALDRLICGAWPSDVTSVLYVSPLKALNNDIQRNLTRPLDDLQRWFAERGEPFPFIEVLTRSGDTAPNLRRRMLRTPPAILITTPESLNLLLTSPAGRQALLEVRTLILDEIHAVVESKRGVHLATAVERLVDLSGEFQRVALSATVNPLETVAGFVGGQRQSGPGVFVPRPVERVAAAGRKETRLRLASAPPAGEGDTLADMVAPLILPIIEQNRSTLVFVNSRRICESLSARLNADRDEPVAYSHHGSLSREVRLDVEQRLKRGQLRCIVATSSLEMGIDIGALDEVVLV